jgi:hypothetical protein
MPASNPIQVKYPLDKRLYTFEDVANLLGHRYPSKLGNVISRVYATKEELGPGGCKLETEHGRSQYMLGDKILDWRCCVIDRYGLETHAHQAIGREPAGFKPFRILCCSTYRLVRRLW